jgi:hypothetical protein
MRLATKGRTARQTCLNSKAEWCSIQHESQPDSSLSDCPVTCARNKQPVVNRAAIFGQSVCADFCANAVVGNQAWRCLRRFHTRHAGSCTTLPTKVTSARILLIRLSSPRLAMHPGFTAEPTRFPQIEILAVARPTVDRVLPLLVLLNVLVSRRSGREFPQNVRARATVPLWIGVRCLHRLLVFALQAVPLLLG